MKLPAKHATLIGFLVLMSEILNIHILVLFVVLVENFKKSIKIASLMFLLMTLNKYGVIYIQKLFLKTYGLVH